MHDKGQGIYFFFIDQNIQLHKLRRLIALELIIKGCITSGTGFQRIKEIVDDLIERKLIFQKCSCLFNVFHAKINASSFLTKLHDRSDKFCRDHDLRTDDRFFHVLNLRRIRQITRIRQFDHFSVCFKYLIYNARCCRDQIQVVFSLQSFLNDLQMQKPQETTAESKSKCDRCFRLIIQGSIVQLQLFQCIPKLRIFGTVCRI